MLKSALLQLGLKNQLSANLDFLEHISSHGISYGTQEEFLFRQKIFVANTEEFARINANPENTFTVGHNFMSTWTPEEYKKLLGYRAPLNRVDPDSVPQYPEPTILDEVNIPEAKDWRSLGAVNPVKNQAQCGSCWAFSATSSMESAQVIQKGGELQSLSEQELVSCDTSSHGCGGGW
jgi:C1A family cysteine protease